MKKVMASLLALISVTLLFVSCTPKTEEFDTSKLISVVTRESASGTRKAFIELFGVEIKDADGNKTDRTTKEAITADRTDIMMTNIANDPYAIGYSSLGSLNETVKALSVDGVRPSAETIKDGSYAVSRPFLIVTKGDATGLAKDFIDFILSKEGQEIAAANAYVPVDENLPAYAGTKPEGRITVEGSSSVSPLMQKWKEAYEDINTKATIDIQTSDSGGGITATKNGSCDIGMSSRDLTDDEKMELKDTKVALDGIVVIVNKQNPLADITGEQVKNIYIGEVTKWSDLITE